MNDTPKVIPGNFSRIKFAPCPEGKDARPATIIGELSCELCGKPMHVKLDKKLKPYAFCNHDHPRNDDPCGQPHYLKPRQWCEHVLKLWTNQRYQKQELAANAPQPEAVTVTQPAPAPAVKPAPRIIAAGKPTAKPAGKSTAGKPAGKPAADPIKPAPARVGGFRAPWDND